MIDEKCKYVKAFTILKSSRKVWESLLRNAARCYASVKLMTDAIINFNYRIEEQSI